MYYAGVPHLTGETLVVKKDVVIESCKRNPSLLHTACRTQRGRLICSTGRPAGQERRSITQCCAWLTLQVSACLRVPPWMLLHSTMLLTSMPATISTYQARFLVTVYRIQECPLKPRHTDDTLASLSPIKTKRPC